MVFSASQANLLALELLADPRAGSNADPIPRTTGVTIIGLVIFRTHRGEQAEAVLDSTGEWRCPRLPVLDRVLNGLFAPVLDLSTDSSTGHAELIRVAAWLGGEVCSLRFPDLAP